MLEILFVPCAEKKVVTPSTTRALEATRPITSVGAASSSDIRTYNVEVAVSSTAKFQASAFVKLTTLPFCQPSPLPWIPILQRNCPLHKQETNHNPSLQVILNMPEEALHFIKFVTLTAFIEIFILV